MANKIPCPQCKQKFKTETGLEWHLNHIHDQPEHSSNLNSRTGTKSLATIRNDISNCRLLSKNCIIVT